jgi:hypothetical protein
MLVIDPKTFILSALTSANCVIVMQGTKRLRDLRASSIPLVNIYMDCIAFLSCRLCMQLDAKEAQTRAEKRRQVLERVNQVLFEQTDKVKGFQGAVLHSDVLAERAAQIKFNKHIAELEKSREAAFRAERAELLDRADNAEIEKLKAAKARALEQKDVQMQQLKDLKAGILAERKERQLEACILSPLTLQMLKYGAQLQ